MPELGREGIFFGDASAPAPNSSTLDARYGCEECNSAHNCTVTFLQLLFITSLLLLFIHFLLFIQVLNLLTVTPDPLQMIELTILLIKYMDNDIAVVKKHPVA